MPDLSPFLSPGLLVAVLAAGALCLAFWPGRGLLGRWRRLREQTARTAREDALKHICSADLAGRPATLESVAGALGLSPDLAAGLLRTLERQLLVTFEHGGLRLTAQGRRQALHVIRAHRLWERYLAERTGLPESEWHRSAERQEHRFSPEEASALSAELGNPSHDPHGDPIPTARGEIVRGGDRTLAELPEGEAAQIVHIEDEPESLYAELVATGLHPRMEVRILERGPERIRLWADGRELTLAPILAHNVSVAPLPAARASEPRLEPRLAGLAPGQKARVASLSPACRGPERRRLLDLGFVPGSLVEAEITSPTGDPTAYRVRGTLIALRREQAEHVHVQTLEERPS